MVFAVPLSLGFHSISEYIEFHTLADFDMNCAMAKLNSKLPDDVRVTALCKKPEKYTKTLASYVYSATYEIMCEGMYNTKENMQEFFDQKSILISKTSKKTGRTTQLDIRDRMFSYRIKKDIKNRMLITIDLRSDSDAMLNPSVFFKAYCDYFRLDIDKLEPVITRTAILDKDGNPLV